LKELGAANVELRVADGFFGWPERAPFDAILLTAAARRIPDPLWQQLREGGRMILPLGEPRQSQTLVRVIKRAGQPAVEELTGVIFVPLTGAIESAR
jgi:protein-L-isoaspartate(D-aspartate) O-methyltransferase